MTTPLSSATQTDPAAASLVQTKNAANNTRPSQKPAQTQSSSTTALSGDTVTISSAAKSLVEEATETKSQTTQEAQNGDVRAQMLLAREQAAQQLQK